MHLDDLEERAAEVRAEQAKVQALRSRLHGGQLPVVRRRQGAGELAGRAVHGERTWWSKASAVWGSVRPVRWSKSSRPGRVTRCCTSTCRSRTLRRWSESVGAEPVKRLRCPTDVPFFARQQKIVLENSGVIDPEQIDDYIAADGYSALVDSA